MFRVHFLSATPIQTALSTHIGVPESNRVSGLRCAALRDPFAWVLSIHPAAYVWPLIEGPMYCNLDSSRPSRLFQVRLPTIRARPICRGKIM